MMKNNLYILGLVIIGAFLGIYFQVPIGALMGSFIFVATAQIFGLGAKPMKKNVKRGVQMVIGGLVGLNVNPEILAEIKTLFLPGILVTVGHMVFAFILALLLSKYLSIQWITALVGTIPAGMSEITTISNNLSADVRLVVMMHLFRVSMVVTILPAIISYFL
jgi:membrane AbrB-like protein